MRAEVRCERCGLVGSTSYRDEATSELPLEQLAWAAAQHHRKHGCPIAMTADVQPYYDAMLESASEWCA